MKSGSKFRGKGKPVVSAYEPVKAFKRKSHPLNQIARGGVRY